MRRWMLVAGSLLVIAAIAIGVVQSGGHGKPQSGALLTSAQARTELSGARPRLASLHAQSNQILGGGQKAFDARVRELRGLPIVINQWGSWCNPCRQEFPVFNHVSAQLGKRVAFLGIDSADNTPAAKRFLAQIPVSYPSYEDGKGNIAGKLGGKVFPATTFYDRRGQTTIHQGPYTSRAALITDIKRYALTG